MSTFKIIGIFKNAGPIETNQGQTRVYKKRSFFIDKSSNPQYPDTPQFWLYDDNINQVGNIKPGTRVEVSFDIVGKSYLKKPSNEEAVFTTLKAYSIGVLQVVSPNSATAPAPQPKPESNLNETGSGSDAQNGAAPAAGSGTFIPPTGGDDDLPF